jgi:hypothetical protein
VIWNWKTQYWVNVTVSNGTPSMASQWVDQGTNISITVDPTNGYQFVGWEGDVSDSQTNDNPIILSADQPYCLTALCEPIQRIFVVNGDSDQKGTPTPYGYGTNIVNSHTVITNTVDAEVIEGGVEKYTCLGWLGTGSIVDNQNGGNTVIFTITNDTTLTWKWDVDYKLDVSSDSNGDTDTIGGWRDQNSVIAITAIPYTNYLFSHWTGDVLASKTNDNPLTVTMNQPRNIMAHFILDPDPDGDGMDTDWEIQYFGDTTRDGTGDFDQDGLTDYEEFFAGTNPTNILSCLRLENCSAEHSMYFEWTSVSGKIYEVQSTTNLASEWKALTNMTGTGETMSYFDSDTEECSFYRIVVK